MQLRDNSSIRLRFSRETRDFFLQEGSMTIAMSTCEVLTLKIRQEESS